MALMATWRRPRHGRFKGYSPRLVLGGRGLSLNNSDTKLYVGLRVTDNERNLQIAIDDKAGGWGLRVKWN